VPAGTTPDPDPDPMRAQDQTPSGDFSRWTPEQYDRGIT
jgi:hypothetical protein